MDAREERLAKNEMVFRDINERIEQFASAQGADPHVYEFVCECSNLDCTLRVSMTLETYEADVRSDPARFVVAPDHDLPEIEDVLVQTEAYEIVRKRGDAADLVSGNA